MSRIWMSSARVSFLRLACQFLTNSSAMWVWNVLSIGTSRDTRQARRTGASNDTLLTWLRLLMKYASNVREDVAFLWKHGVACVATERLAVIVHVFSDCSSRFYGAGGIRLGVCEGGAGALLKHAQNLQSINASIRTASAGIAPQKRSGHEKCISSTADVVQRVANHE